MSLAAFHAIRDCRSKRWLAAHLDYPHDDRCLIWPFARKGGGYVTMGKKGVLVHRVACEHRNGPPPSPEHHAAHSCGCGHDGCINQWHLNWRTPSENQFERYEHSGPTPRYKLTADLAAQIRGMKGMACADAVAVQFNISESNVRLIWAGKIWNAKPPYHIFTDDEVRVIRSTPRQERTARQLAAQFGVGMSAIERIRQGVSYRLVKTEDSMSGVPPANQSSAEAIENKGPSQSS